MAKRYGVPYGMSKNRIARRLIDFLPPAEVFVDLMAGGCAVAHAALESRKYRHVIINDINPLPTQLFIDAVAGKYRNERRVIDRKTFHALKDSDPYVRYCWSFGTKGRDYLWGEDIEPIKLAACRMVLSDGAEQAAAAKEFHELTDFFFDPELIDCLLAPPTWQLRRQKYSRYFERLVGEENISKVHPLQSIKGLDQLFSLTNAVPLDAITRYVRDYQDVPIPKDSVIYCDIPYDGSDVTQTMCGGFDYAAFYKWTRRQKNVFVSSYDMPEQLFEGVRGWSRQGSMNATGSKGKVLEKLFIPRVA